MPQSGSLLAGESRYYGVRVGEGEAASLTVALTPTEGDPDLYVSGSGRYPTRDEAQWSSSLGQGEEDLVYVPSHDPLACTGCTYRALVYAYSDTSYSITMSLRSPAAPSLTVLQAGVPSSAHVEQGEYAFFSFAVQRNASISITLTAFSGDPDLYAAFTTQAPPTSLQPQPQPLP